MAQSPRSSAGTSLPGAGLPGDTTCSSLRGCLTDTTSATSTATSASDEVIPQHVALPSVSEEVERVPADAAPGGLLPPAPVPLRNGEEIVAPTLHV